MFFNFGHTGCFWSWGFSCVARQGLSSCGSRALERVGSVVAPWHGGSQFLDQGSNPHPMLEGGFFWIIREVLLVHFKGVPSFALTFILEIEQSPFHIRDWKIKAPKDFDSFFYLGKQFANDCEQATIRRAEKNFPKRDRRQFTSFLRGYKGNQ